MKSSTALVNAAITLSIFSSNVIRFATEDRSKTGYSVLLDCNNGGVNRKSYSLQVWSEEKGISSLRWFEDSVPQFTGRIGILLSSITPEMSWEEVTRRILLLKRLAHEQRWAIFYESTVSTKV